MKSEFNKWWIRPEIKDYFENEGHYDMPNEAAYCAWKACLEWVLSKRDKHCCFENCLVHTEIQKELDLLSKNESN